MQLSAKSLALTCGLLWGGAVLLVALANLVWPSYGVQFLQVIASVYPGYSGTAFLGQVIVGTLYAFADGLIGGWIFAWLYNRLVPHRVSSQTVM